MAVQFLDPSCIINWPRSPKSFRITRAWRIAGLRCVGVGRAGDEHGATRRCRNGAGRRLRSAAAAGCRAPAPHQGARRARRPGAALVSHGAAAARQRLKPWCVWQRLGDEGGLGPRSIVRGLEYGRAYASVALQVATPRRLTRWERRSPGGR